MRITSTDNPSDAANVFKRGKHIPSLDGWRALAILLVLGDHSSYASPANATWASPLAAIADGNLGVRIFFVLSGFLISLLLLREAHKTGDISLSSFYIRRTLRIMPVYVVYIAVLATLAGAGLYTDSFSSWLGVCTFTRNVVGKGTSATLHFWSLAVEEQFYVIWPVTFACFRLYRRPATYALVLISVALTAGLSRYLSTGRPGGDLVDRLLGDHSILLCIDSLAIGCLTAGFAFQFSFRLPPYWRTPLIAVCVSIIITGRWLALTVEDSVLHAIIPTIQALAIATLIWCTAVSRSGMLYWFLNLPVVAWLGVLSYSIYIWHVIFLPRFVGSYFTDWPTHDYRTWILSSLVAAVLSYYLLERPCLSLKQKWNPKDAPSATNDVPLVVT